ncbi:hypothetical protein EUX98_g5816 [Antrodiella citrinella]|uniref:Uncharacterized protein n=1 Tax=Antrodiella citrinella TaxID=2447956 RepID=A0A4S4MRH4_9APHY|nr:hypothetical protein EUX98_g5816 [Antrodiella citrinella]
MPLAPTNTSATASDPLSELSEELPPAYTPAPDPYQGEQSVEFGPRRPFQRAPAQPPLLRPQQQTGPWLSPQPTGWPGYPGQGQMYSHPSAYMNPRPGFAPPPPSHPLSASREARPASYMVPSSAASDFARDFYTAGAPADVSVLGGSSEAYTAQNGNGPSAENEFNPPPGLPPRPSGSSGHSRSRSDASANRGGSSSTANAVPDDGKPTKTPTPGHPLLNHGNILVYPKGYECKKCHNTGYKHFDPLNPCKKCWPKYSKEYSGAITYTPWSSSGNTTSEGGKVYQRPLPVFPPPHQPSRSYLTRPVSLGRELTVSAPGSSYRGASPGRVMPIGGDHLRPDLLSLPIIHRPELS